MPFNIDPKRLSLSGFPGGSVPLDTHFGKDNFFAAPLTSIATCVHGPAFNHVGPLSMEISTMKRIALVVAVLALAACTKKDEAPVDTGAAMAPAPAAMDTGMKMMDSTMMKDSMMKDSMMKADSGKMKKK